MSKESLLKNIASTAYNVGFGGKKHFITYDIYRILPRLISVLTIIIGIYQLSVWYENINNTQFKDLASITLIVVGVLGLVLDLLSNNKEEYNEVGKELLRNFNELRDMYFELKSLDETLINIESYENRRKDIVTNAQTISKSDQAIFTHWLTNMGFFHTMQSKWVVEELELKFKDKYPLLHQETFMFLLIILILIVIIC